MSSEGLGKMLSVLRFLAIVVSGSLTVVLGVMGLISTFRYSKHGSITKKAIRISAMYMALCAISGMLTVIILDPTKMPAALVSMAIALFCLTVYIAASYLHLTLAEKGLRRMLAPVWRFLRRLFIPHGSD